VQDQLIKKADRLLKIKAVRDVYENILPHNNHFKPDTDPLDKAFLVSEIILRLGEGPELEEMAAACDRGPELNLPDAKTKIDLEDYSKELIDKTYQQMLEAMDKALDLYKEKRLRLKQPEDDYTKDFIEIASSQLYHNFRDRISTGNFQITVGDKWPVADLSSKVLKSKAYIMPDRDEPVVGDDLRELQELMASKVTDLAKEGDIAADVFDIVTAKWLKEAKHYEAMVTLTADDILKARGLLPRLGGKGGRGGYREHQRKEIQQKIDVLSYTWVTVEEMDIVEIIKGKRKVSKWRGESKAIALTSRFGQIRADGSTDAFAWRLRPGDVFARFLFGPGRQTALLSQKALNYDPYRQKWEKRLARYLAWIWRISSGRTQEGLLVKTLLDAANMEMDRNRPSRTRERLEEALDCLQADRVITAWQYDNIDENMTSKRGWWRNWLECKVIITAPTSIITQYKKIKDRAGSGYIADKENV
jgi:hypothetical protein